MHEYIQFQAQYERKCEMNINAQLLETPLAKGAFMRIEDISEVEVLCLEGHVWLTTDHDLQDIILAPGKSFTSKAHRPAIVSALDASKIRLTAS
jgi:quercetin dioxygenase-like cupin family protein